MAITPGLVQKSSVGSSEHLGVLRMCFCLPMKACSTSTMNVCCCYVCCVKKHILASGSMRFDKNAHVVLLLASDSKL